MDIHQPEMRMLDNISNVQMKVTSKVKYIGKCKDSIDIHFVACLLFC